MEQRFEYKVVKFAYYSDSFESTCERELNHYAKDGWKLVGQKERGSDLALMFERPFGEYKDYNNSLVDYITNK